MQDLGLGSTPFCTGPSQTTNVHSMEAALQAPPATPTYSDDNLDYARLRFGYASAPEHEFPTMEVSSLPILDQASSHRTPPYTIELESEHEAEESEDVARVEELVSGGDDFDGGDEIPFSAEYVDDEPSSVLAMRISRAMDNPSPPPSPLLPLTELEPTFSGPSPPSSEKSNTSDNSVSFGSEDSVPLNLPSSHSTTLSNDSNMEVEATRPTRHQQQQDLINFDMTTLEIPFEASLLEHASVAPDSAVSAIDALLLNSPSVDDFAPPFSDFSEAVMVKDSSEIVAAAPSSETSILAPSPSPPTTIQPLRRSPRKSVNPTMSLPSAPSIPGPSTRSPRKKPKLEEIDEGSQDESDFVLGDAIASIQSTALTTPRGRERRLSRSPMVYSREVGSLSPTTSNLLTQLIPSFTDATPLHLDAEPTALSEQNLPPRGMQSFSVFLAPPDLEPSTPQRPSNPIRPETMPSPSKLRMQASQQDVAATPARRITIEEAIETGQLSPLKAAQMGFVPRGALPSMPQTPARRILISEKPVQAPSSTKGTPRFGSPVRSHPQGPTSQGFAGSSTSTVQSSQKTLISSLQRSTAATTTNGNPSSDSGKLSNLPFPLVAAEKPSSATTVNGKDISTERSHLSSPAKSNLKQVKSRIPRIGVKPYAKPPAAAKSVTQKPVPIPAAPTMRRVDLSKRSTRMVVNRGLPSTTAFAKSERKETHSIRPVVPSASTSNETSSAVNAVKRKRSPDKIVSPVKSRMPSSRQTSTLTSRSNPSAPQKPTQPIVRISKVVDPISAPALPIVQPALPSSTNSTLPAIPQETGVPQRELTPVEHDNILGSPMNEDASAASSVQLCQSLMTVSTQATEIPTIQIDPPVDTPPISSLPPNTRVRRTTRQRKMTPMVDPVVNEPRLRATTSRRKASQGPRFVFTDAYSEMSATALKQLTATNTLRNQQYITARLEVQVIKKDGLRPESPMVKIKTIAQRQQEEKADKRAERAQRRARRSGEIPGSSDLEMDSDDEGVVHSSDADEISNWPRMQHVRGAGEEENYETPDRAFKRMKLTDVGFEDVDMDTRKRRVKWDRGLFTTVYLNEVVLGTRQPLKEHNKLKGCLTPAAKALRLDTLGNLGGSESPFPELVPQNVTVKKFVYEGDMEPVIEVMVPKATRSKSKKARS